MTGNIKAEILQIKDLKVIFFYSLNQDYKNENSTDLLGLNIVFGDNKTLNFDYTSPYFQDFVLKVLEVYKEEKETNNITLMNELSKNLLANLNVDSFKENNNFSHYHYQDRPILEYSNRKNELEVAKTYMKNVIKDILPFFVAESDKEEILITGIKGYQNRFFADCCNQYFNCIVPFILKRTGKSDYLFKIAGINQSSHIINGEISIEGGIVNSSWKLCDVDLKGQEIFKSDGLHERSIFSFGDIIDFDNKVDDISTEEKELIDFYLKFLGIKEMDKGIKVDDERFLLSNKQVDDDNVVTEVSAHLLLRNNLINVVLVNKCGLAKYDNTFILPISETFEDISIYNITIENEKYLLVQRHFFTTEKMRGSYDEIDNKYSYQLYKANIGDNLLDQGEIVSEINLDKTISSLNDIKKYVKRGEVN